MRQIASDSNVEFVQVDGIRHALAVPNDTRFGDQWHYADSAVGIRAPTAWNTSTGTGVVVAVIDSGILSHTDLNANILPGYDMISSTTGFSDAECQQAGASPGCGKSDDGNGRDSNPNDSSNIVHGTHVAGTIAAVTNNAAGVAGVAYNAKVVPVRVLGNQGFGSDSDIADAIVWPPAAPSPACRPTPIRPKSSTCRWAATRRAAKRRRTRPRSTPRSPTARSWSRPPATAISMSPARRRPAATA
ncbi:S8 family serine peptidase [Lysobacter gummosus]|uniref:S8 family serine peptidase n=1 Tax=Lysobacter gummosus TaxID=262324 RepID=UPI003630030A